MKDHSLTARLTPWKEKPYPRRVCSLFIAGWIAAAALSVARTSSNSRLSGRKNAAGREQGHKAVTFELD